MSERTLDDEMRFTVLRLLADNPEASQRELAKELGISLGKVNYCVRALLDKGYVKAVNFKNNRNKSAYLYLLTPSGVAAKAKATAQFLVRKEAEYEQLAAEIEALRAEVQRGTDDQHDESAASIIASNRVGFDAKP